MTLANELAKRLSGLEYGVKAEHRDIGKDGADIIFGRREEGTL